MRRNILEVICLLFVLSLPVSPMAADLTEADALYDQGGADNLLASAQLFVKALETDPTSYEAAWKASRSYREYANVSKKQEIKGWEDICKEYGKLGMIYGEKAIDLDPTMVNGYFWYGCSVGNYSDGTGIVTALKEGLKNKTQSSFEKAYELDKLYQEGGPIKALGRFWFVLPWGMRDYDKALTYLKEYQQLFPDDTEGQVYLAEVLIKTKAKDEAKVLLEKATASDDKYYAGWAEKLLHEI